MQNIPANHYEDGKWMLRKLNLNPILAHALWWLTLVLGGMTNIIHQDGVMDALREVVTEHPELSSQLNTWLYMQILNFVIMLAWAGLILYAPEPANKVKEPAEQVQ